MFVGRVGVRGGGIIGAGLGKVLDACFCVCVHV